jgi:hypothetical protein
MIFRKYLLFLEHFNPSPINKDIFLELYLQSIAFIIKFKMIEAVEVFGCSSAAYKSIFSCLI